MTASAASQIRTVVDRLDSLADSLNTNLLDGPTADLLRIADEIESARGQTEVGDEEG